MKTNDPNRSDRYDKNKASAWRSLYNTSPRNCANYILKAFRLLTQFGEVSAA
ncbi:MAG: hypothetical protein V7K56_19165 [Nostoc sp.]